MSAGATPAGRLHPFPLGVRDIVPELTGQPDHRHERGYHGTHTSAIAAGTLSSQGFGGMAPDADLVLIPAGYFDENLYDEEEDAIEEALALGRSRPCGSLTP